MREGQDGDCGGRTGLWTGQGRLAGQGEKKWADLSVRCPGQKEANAGCRRSTGLGSNRCIGICLGISQASSASEGEAQQTIYVIGATSPRVTAALGDGDGGTVGL